MAQDAIDHTKNEKKFSTPSITDWGSEEKPAPFSGIVKIEMQIPYLISQLFYCRKREHAFPLNPNSLLRMYRISFHSSYDLLHVMGKMLKSPTSDILDSRDAFTIHM